MNAVKRTGEPGILVHFVDVKNTYNYSNLFSGSDMPQPMLLLLRIKRN